MYREIRNWLAENGLIDFGFAFAIAFVITWFTTRAAKIVLSKGDKETLALWFMGETEHWSKSFNQLFDIVFGEKHFTIQCFLRSTVASISFVFFLWWLFGEQERIESQEIPWWFFLAGALLINSFADYISLLETRWLLRKIDSYAVGSRFITLPVLLLDTIFTGLIIFSVISIYQFSPLNSGDSYSFSEIIALFSPYSIFFYSTFLTSIWVWIYLASYTILRFFKVYKITDKLLRGVEDNPITLLGVVIFVLCFSVSWVGLNTLKAEEKGGLVIDKALCELFSGKVCTKAMQLTEDEERKLEFLVKACPKGGITKRCVGHGLKGADLNSEEAVELFARACFKGRLDICSGLATRLAMFKEVKRDLELATLLNLKSCEEGLNWGCKNLAAHIGIFNKAVIEMGMFDRALEITLSACENGNLDTCKNLWSIYHSIGVGDKKSDTEMLNHLDKILCECKDLDACHRLADRYFSVDSSLEEIETAIQIHLNGCDLDYLPSCRDLAIIYLEGEYRDTDEQLALDYLFRACAEGEGSGCSRLAILYMDGEYLEKDSSYALELLDRACVNKDYRACFNVGVFYFNGNEIDKNLEKAKEYFELACHKDSKLGCGALAIIYRDALGVEKNKTKAAELFEQGCTKTSYKNCFAFAKALERGDGIEQNIPRAMRIYNDICNKKYGKACTRLGFVIEKGGHGVKVTATSAEYFYGGCIYDDENGCLLLAKEFLSKEAFGKAAEFYDKACEKGNAQGCYNFAVLLKRGQGVKKDSKYAMRLFESQCNKDYVNACINAAVYYANGDGIKQNLNKGAHYFRRACELGDKDSCDVAIEVNR